LFYPLRGEILQQKFGKKQQTKFIDHEANEEVANFLVGFTVLTAVAENIVSLYVTPCCILQISQNFGGACYFFFHHES
jgi:hypothetical protein